jgi:hypothetical protein
MEEIISFIGCLQTILDKIPDNNAAVNTTSFFRKAIIFKTFFFIKPINYV